MREGLRPLTHLPFRRFASVCGACGKLIVPHNGRDACKVECLGRTFHEDCYRCEVGLGHLGWVVGAWLNWELPLRALGA